MSSEMFKSSTEGKPTEDAQLFSHGRTTELIQDSVQGLIVPPGDPVRLRESIELALADRDATARRAAAARALVEGPLSFEARMRAVEAVYEELGA